MGCFCSHDREEPKSGKRCDNVMPYLVERESKDYYDVTFPTKPLYISITSSINDTDGYITSVLDKCPVKEKIVENSKIIYINGDLVEGCDGAVIANRLAASKPPITLTLAYPKGLDCNELPAMNPVTIINVPS